MTSDPPPDTEREPTRSGYVRCPRCDRPEVVEVLAELVVCGDCLTREPTATWDSEGRPVR